MFLSALEGLVSKLTGAGLSASVDMRDLNPPAVYVRPDAMVPLQGKLCGTYDLRVSLLLVVNDSGDLAATRNLDALYATVVGAVGPALANDERVFQRVALPTDPTLLPCLQLTAQVPL